MTEPAATVSLGDPDALLFDLDGTVVDTVETRIISWLETFREMGIPADRAHVAGLIGSDGRRLAREVAGITGRDLDDDRTETIDRRAGERFSALNTAPLPLPGVVEVMTALHDAGVAWAIATSSRSEQIHASIDALGLPFPPRVVDGSSVRHAKPAPDLLLLAAERIGLPAGRCWYVGDATWDMLAARAATMPAIGITTGAVDEETLRASGAAMVFATMTGLHQELIWRGILRG